jgi:hypothetical protein
MRVEEAVECMTALYLRRIIDSFARDFRKPNEQQAREIIVRNVKELTDPARIEHQLSSGDGPYSARILQRNALKALLKKPGWTASEAAIVKDVMALEKATLREARDRTCMQYEDGKSIDILRAVLEVAIEDDAVSREELSLVERLRQKLGIKARSTDLILAQLKHFPRRGNQVHSPSEIAEALAELQRLGAVFYCNKLGGGVHLIPEEVVPGVQRALGIELAENAWRLLLDGLTSRDLGVILRRHGLPGGGHKEERIARVLRSGLQPSEVLGTLTSAGLYAVLSGLPGANVSGTKEARIRRIIDYYANLVIHDVPKEAAPGQVYYEYLVELARRDRESLLANKVITKDRDMDSAFEEGTRWLFRNRLGLRLLDMPGSDHPDGTLELRSGDLLMWDTKSKEDVYRFPRTHVRQFKRYIRDSGRRVSAFLVIVPEIGKGAETSADLLKSQSGDDTDVALITAEDLKWLAEKWAEASSGKGFDPEVFNVTGTLGRSKLEQRMKLFL